MKGLVLSVGLLAAVFFVIHPTRFFRDWGEHLDPFRTPVVFTQRADAICADYERRVSDLPEPAMDVNGMRPIRSFAARLQAIAEQEVAKLHALPLPTKNRELAKAWIATHDQLVVLLGQLRYAAQKEDKGAVLLVGARLDANTEREDELALRLGISGCSDM